MEVTSLKQQVNAYSNDRMSSNSQKPAKAASEAPVAQDSYTPSDSTKKKIAYEKPQLKDIQKLKEESEAAYSNLRQTVTELLKRQGYTDEQIKNGQIEDFKVDDKARAEAQAAIGPGGESSPECVSDRIVEFAKSLSNGDKAKFKQLKDAIENGFNAAKEAFGGKLPEICDKTYKLVQEKLDKWEKEPVVNENQ